MQRRSPTGNIPIELLRAVVATVDLGSFSKAAQALRLTQPAISSQMRRLKQLVGTEVFSKAGSTLVLTDRGALVVKYARRILAMNDQILSLGGGPVQSLRLGVPFVFAPTILSDVLQIEGNVDGETEIQIFCDSSDELKRRLAAGYLDIAFVISPQDFPAQVITEWAEPWVWVGSPDLPLSPGDTIPLILTPNRSPHHRSGRKGGPSLRHSLCRPVGRRPHRSNAGRRGGHDARRTAGHRSHEDRGTPGAATVPQNAVGCLSAGRA